MLRGCRMPWIIVAGTAAAIRSRSAVESLTSSAFKFARLAVPPRHKRLSTSQPAFRTAAPDYAVACIRARGWYEKNPTGDGHAGIGAPASPPGDEYSLRALFRNARGSVCLYPSRRPLQAGDCYCRPEAKPMTYAPERK